MSDIAVLAVTGFVNADRATINNNFQYLQEHFRSATEPASPRAGQFWIDSAGAVDILKVRNRANSAWVIIGPDISVAGGGLLPLSGGTMTGVIAMGSQKITGLANGTAAADAVNWGQVNARIHAGNLYFPGFANATGNYPLGAGTGASFVISDVWIISDTATAGSGAGTRWDFQVRNVTAALNLLATAKTTNGAEIAVNTRYALGVDQNQTIAANDVLQLQITKTGSPTDLSAARIVVQVNYKVTT